MRTAVCLLFAAAAARADDWPQWLGADRSGVWKETGIVEKFPADGPKRVWSAPVGGGYAGPAVANGVVYVMDRIAKPAKPNEGIERVLALDAATGKDLWKHEYDSTYRIQYAAGPRCTPTVDGDRVYTLGAMGELRCLTASDGKLVWAKNYVTDFDARVPTWGFAGHPLVDGNNLICVTGGKKGNLAVAFDKLTGKTVWQAIALSETDCGYAPPVIGDLDGVRTLIVWHGRAVVGLDPATGKILWQHDFPVKYALTAPTPLILPGGRVFVSAFYEGSHMLRVKGSAVEVLWQGHGRSENPDQSDTLHSIMPKPCVVGDHIYGVCSYAELRCLDAATGKRVWMTRKPTVGTADEEGKPTRWGNAFLTPQGDRFWLFNEKGELILAKLSPAGYEELGRAKVIAPTTPGAGRPVVWSHPAFAGRAIYVRNDRELIRLDLAAGAK